MTPSPWPRAAAALGLLIAGAMAVSLVTQRPGSRGVLDVSGLWTARVEDGPGLPVGLPGEVVSQGVPADHRVVLSRSVTVPGTGPQALWIDAPRWSPLPKWDGTPLTTPREHPSRRGLLAIVPASDPFTRHELSIELDGRYGVAGTGAIVLGPPQVVHGLVAAVDARRTGVALVIALAALVSFAVRASRERGASAHGWLGATNALLAVDLWATSATAEELLGALGAWRIGLAASAATPVVAWRFVVCQIGADPPRWAVRLAWGMAAPVGAVLVAPHAWLSPLQIVPLLIGISTLAAVWPVLSRGWREGRPMFAALASVAGPAIVAALGEIAFPDPWGGWSLAGILMFAGAALSVLVLSDVDRRDRGERLLEASVDGLVVVDAEGRIADWGPAAAAVLGADPASANLIAHVHADDRPIARAHLARSADREDRADFRIVVGERDRVIESVGRPHPGGAAQLVLRDVTQRRSLDQGLLHAARLETVAVLLGGIAHDFNNMLGTLLAHVGILQSTVTDERAAERLGRMEATIERASQLTRRLLTVSRGSASSLGPVELDRVLRAAADLVEPTLPHNIRLVEDVPEGVAPVHGDAQDLEQVVVNLLVNARDALKEGGNIRLAVRPWSLEGGHRGLAVLVEDDGTGVPPNLVADVFQPFVTTKGRKGTGLGLAVASQILRDHQGRIWYEDRPGGGARFLLALRHADALDEAPAPLPEGRRILLVEDEEVLIEGYARALRESGYDVVPFQRAADAAAWLEGHRPDVLVTDVVMEGMNGIELATLCQAAHPTVPILVVSGFIPDDSVRALSAGTWHRLHKPVRAARLVATVGRIRRRVERAARGEADITRVTWLFPPLDVLNAARLGFDTRP